MERIDLIKEVYSKITKAFLENIADERKTECQEAYLKYLKKSYDSYFEVDTEEEFSRVAVMCIKKEKVINIGKREDEKIAFLFPDNEFLKLENLSLELAALAQNKKRGENYDVIKTKEDYLLQLKVIYDSVDELFRYSAERVYSESLVDLEYIFGDGSVSSFRNLND